MLLTLVVCDNLPYISFERYECLDQQRVILDHALNVLQLVRGADVVASVVDIASSYHFTLTF